MSITDTRTGSESYTHSLPDSKMIKNEDYEIVIILEGNIETTGASCHIRTSYLPQEILFGYRFTPIYPKFSNFEYSFDYAKFDQVEPIQQELLGLNLNIINPHLNYIYDARNEDKNLYQTYQNTVIEANDKTIKNNLGQRDNANSLFTLLSAFKANNPAQTEPAPLPVTSFVRKKSDLKSFDRGNSITVLEEKPGESCPDRADCSSNNQQKTCKTGRFTVQPVLDKSLDLHVITNNINERLETSGFFNSIKKRQMQKKTSSKLVLFKQQQQQQQQHHRASSLPLADFSDQPMGLIAKKRQSSSCDLGTRNSSFTHEDSFDSVVT